ncbi:hypothetical protein EFER_0312 [Escherichia fergusonii ATCC 35469]|nr:hypothetical protein EFER_0312 [Escherichia fergusonii ATCC 35469]STN21138.1 Domain of uncharacterised function (DUF2825) [Escherichia fergusonii]
MTAIRFIPAGAGNSNDGLLQQGLQPVYPRWRGELVEENQKEGGYYGLSPLARGTRSPRDQRLHVNRFIPAGAGNSSFHFTCPFCLPVYPRWRGELFSSSVSAL